MTAILINKASVDIKVPWFLKSKRRLLFTLFLAVTCPMMALALLNGHQIKQSLAQRAMLENAIITHLVSQSVSEHFEGLMQYVGSFSHHSQLIKGLRQGNSTEVETVFRIFLEKNDYFDRIFVTDLKGIQWYDHPTDASTSGIDLSGYDWFLGVSSSQKPYISQVYKRKSWPQKTVIAIAYPVKDSNGKIFCYLTAEHPLEKLTKWLSKIGIPAPGSVFLVDRNGTLATQDPQKTEKPINLKENPLVQKALSSADGSVEMDDPVTGERSLISYTSLPGIRWGIFARQPIAAVFEPVKALQKTIIVFTLLGIPSLFTLGFFWLNTIHRYHHALIKKQTALGRSEDDLRNQTVMLNLIINSIAEGVVVADKDGKFLIFNPAGEQLTGLGTIDEPPEKWTERYGIFLADRITPCPSENLPLVRAMRGEEVDNAELFIRNIKRPEGAWLSLNARPLKNEKGQPLGGVVVFHDITERKRAELALSKYTQELARSNTDLEQFAYIASHDLQDPLRMVANYTHMLLKHYSGQIDSKADEFIAQVDGGVKRMQKLIDDLLVYSRVETEGKKFQLINCNGVMENVIANLSVFITESKASVTFDPLPNVMADATQLVQLFQNLISNSLKFRGKEPPLIHVSAALSQKKGGDVLQETANEWIFSVKDNGIGLEPQYAERIFIIFQRLHSQTAYPGTGIGLALCKKIIERHRGKIWVESEPGKGSTFYFSVPAAQ